MKNEKRKMKNEKWKMKNENEYQANKTRETYTHVYKALYPHKF